MKKILVAVPAMLMSTAAFAQSKPGTPAVPEISALQGVAAIAAIAAVVLLVWERSRRAA